MLDSLNDRLEALLKPLGERFKRLSTAWKVIIAILLAGLALYLEW
jgi:hypothetical protein